MRSAIIAFLLLVPGVRASAQLDAAPAGLARVEIERSRACVGILSRLSTVSTLLEPIAARSQRLLMISDAIALEDPAVVQLLDSADPVEVQVREWFSVDAAYARRNVSAQSATITAERSAARETIKTLVSQALTEVETQANAIVSENQALMEEAAPCDGAIFVRQPVIEACQTEAGPVCEEVGLPPSPERAFRFVDDAETMWDVEEVRPWTDPGPLRAGPTGLAGARTVGFARVGNVVLSVSFAPLFRALVEATPDQLSRFRAVNDSLGITFAHDELTFTPGVGIRAALPVPLDEEVRYIFHFGEPEDPDVIWTGDAGTGRVLQQTLPLGAAHVLRLQSGEQLTMTALGAGADGSEEPLYAIGLTNVNQRPATQALLAYMVSRLSTDLAALTRATGNR